MSRDLEGAVLLVLGVVVGRVTLEGSYLAYVKASLFWPLLATSLVLLVLGFATLRRDPRHHAPAVHHAVPAPAGNAAGTPSGDPVPDGVTLTATSVTQPHGHRPPRSGMLLLLPVLVLVLAAPPPLGAFAAARGSVNNLAADAAADLPPLDQRGDEPVELSISEFVLRTYATGDASVRGVPVLLTGFVAEHDAPDAFLLSRFAVACCAADASPRQVLVHGDAAPEEDTWAQVVVVWDGPVPQDDEDRVPEVVQQHVEQVDPPDEPYEYAAY